MPVSHCATLKASDIEATMAWYRAIGFEVRGRFPDTDPTWCEVARDDLALQFISGETPWPQAPGCTGCFYVRPATSVTEVHGRLAAVVPVPWGVEERPWGARELVLQDPDGYFITFTEELEGGAAR